MLILGIDPGSRKAGYAIIRYHQKSLSYVDSGALKYDVSGEFVDRLGSIYDSCHGLIEKYGPHEVAIESLIYVKSIPALSKLAQARGAMIAAFTKSLKGKIFEYSPNLVKSSVTGHGHSGKEGVSRSLQLLFGKIQFKSNDESDALAIAVCHALNRPLEKRAFSRSLV